MNINHTNVESREPYFLSCVNCDGQIGSFEVDEVINIANNKNWHCEERDRVYCGECYNKREKEKNAQSVEQL